jgi:uncharacterized sulfatase
MWERKMKMVGKTTLGLVLIWLCCLVVAAPQAAQSRPNVLLIISDDHGWSDYGFMGHPQVRTPNIDRLAKEGMLFSRGYVPSSLCRPSLASMMTGLYPHQHGITGNDPPGDIRNAAARATMVEQFRRSENITQALARQGYVSFQSGKWWEGDCVCCGFTECMTHGDVARGGRHGDEGLKIGRETMQPLYDFIDRAGGKPFFLWYAPMMPHTPHNPPERLLARYQAMKLPPLVAKYYAMVEWFDETVGQLLDHLEKKGLARNTLVLYVSDNGWVQTAEQKPLFDARAKLSPYDAGLRTPIIVKWPAKLKSRRDDATLVSSIDLAPTVYAACGVKASANLPGINLLDSRRLSARKAVYGSTFAHTIVALNDPASGLKYRWVVRDRWKLIAPYHPNLELPIYTNQPASYWSAEDELYDLAADPKEQNNLALKRPELVQSLKTMMNRWWQPGR